MHELAGKFAIVHKNMPVAYDNVIHCAWFDNIEILSQCLESHELNNGQVSDWEEKSMWVDL